MKSLRFKLNTSTVLPMVAGLGVVIVGPLLASNPSAAQQATENPVALPYVQLAQCNPCNPCAANPCNPCAANPCNPCAANPCNPCAANPCNPCAANPCNPCAANPCNPCAAANPCNPCAANPCNPCAAGWNPCNPCAANPCNPCAAGAGGAASNRCFVPRLRTAGYNPCNPCAAANPCNPCAAANPCNPCAAANPCNPCAAANPCNPCAAANPCNPCAAANPCNPCAAANPCNPCAANPCNPCGAAVEIELTSAEAIAAYDCMKPEMQAAYAASGNAIAINYQSFDYYSTEPYVSALHGARYVTNVANQSGSAYRRYEEAGTMRNGGVLGKDSFVVGADGSLSVGPLFLMQKMPAGFYSASADWKYTMVMPDGSIFGETNGRNSAAVQFCIDCHEVAGTDHMFFLPVELRVN